MWPLNTRGLSNRSALEAERPPPRFLMTLRRPLHDPCHSTTTPARDITRPPTHKPTGTSWFRPNKGKSRPSSKPLRPNLVCPRSISDEFGQTWAGVDWTWGGSTYLTWRAPDRFCGGFDQIWANFLQTWRGFEQISCEEMLAAFGQLWGPASAFRASSITLGVASARVNVVSACSGLWCPPYDEAVSTNVRGGSDIRRCVERRGAPLRRLSGGSTLG